MKTLRQLSIIGLTVILGLTSCTMEKRVYMSGYHIEWNKNRHHADKSELASNNNAKQTEQNQTVTVEQTETASNAVDDSFAPPVNEENLTASVGNEQIILPQKEKINLSSSHKVKTTDEEKETKPSFKSEFKKGAKMILANADEPKTNGMALAGFICSLAGLLLFGFILGTLAVIFSAIGLGKINKDPAKWKGKGMAIAGLIIGVVDIVAWLIIIALLL
jgi:hypothetical protein